jgi:RimJ/RimL family protein N-acetyltransferase
VPARILTYADTPLVRQVLARDPVANVFVSSRIDAGVLNPIAPGLVYGTPSEAPTALLHLGANLVPVAEDLEPIPAFVEAAGRRRTCQSIVGPSWLALPLWEALGRRWGRAYSDVREVRRRQPLMVIDHPPLVEPDPRVQRIAAADFESYFAASVAMYIEEVGVDPGTGRESSYRSYCRWLVGEGRAFGIIEAGRVIFKADIGAASGAVAQIQGVWLEPSLRGHGASVPAMAAVAEYVLAEYGQACLYVNDFNTPAVRSYLRVGFEQVGELATVLY